MSETATQTTQATPKPDETKLYARKGFPEQSKDEVNREEAHAEYEQRKEHQKSVIEKIGNEKLLEMLEMMILSRRFEEKCAEVYRIGKIGGFCHLYIGQEACAIGAFAALDPKDMVITSYRDHVHALARGVSAESVMAELYGKVTGTVKGKGGSMHFFSAEHELYGGHGIVGGQIGVGTGMAYAAKYKESGQVTLCFFGEAAVNQGIFHESLNMAQLWKLPIIYICENNHYGMGTSIQRAMSLQYVAQKASAYDMASEFVDGMDVLAVHEAFGRAAERARSESLPSLIEVRTYRFMGHSMSDPGNYRTRAEIEKYQERDPIKVFTTSLRDKGVVDDAAVKEIEDRVRAEVERAVKFADESPEPAPVELFTHVYANPITRES